MITASHNPKEYNGYKVYGADGAQMSPEDTEKVVGYISKIDDYLSASGEENSPLILPVPEKLDEDYIEALSRLRLSPEAVKKCGANLKLVYTPVHGSGYVPVTTILKKLGINVTVVEEQTTKDPEFSTVKVPNPEFKETLSMGIALANKIHADVVFGTDPDSDRLGVAVKDDKGEFTALSGNQVGILLLDYILTRLEEENAMPTNAAVVKSFVTTGMAKAICDDFGVTCSKPRWALSLSAKRSNSGKRTENTLTYSASRSPAGIFGARTRGIRTRWSLPCCARRWSAIIPMWERRCTAVCGDLSQIRLRIG